MSSSQIASPGPIRIACPQPPIATTSPLYPVVLQALQHGVALREQHGHLWQFGKCLHPLRDLRASLRHDGWSLLRALEERIAWNKASGRIWVNHLDQEVLDRGVDRLLGQPGIVWDFGAALRTLHEQQSCDRPAFAAAVLALESEWPRSYLSFAMAVAGNLSRDQIAGHDVDAGALAVIVRAPHLITPELLSIIESRQCAPAWPVLRAREASRPDDPKAAQLVGSGLLALGRTLEWSAAGAKRAYRGMTLHRLWVWARIADVFSVEQVTRAGIDEGKLSSLLCCPGAVRRALWPLAPTMSHQGLASVALEQKQAWEHKMTGLKKKVARRLALRATESALEHDALALGTREVAGAGVPFVHICE